MHFLFERHIRNDFIGIFMYRVWTFHENILSLENWVFLLLLRLDTIGAETDGSTPLQINKTPLKICNAAISENWNSRKIQSHITYKSKCEMLWYRKIKKQVKLQINKIPLKIWNAISENWNSSKMQCQIQIKIWNAIIS